MQQAAMLKGKLMWGVVAGRPNGSSMTLHFGGKVLRPPFLRHDKLPGPLRRHNGELIVYVSDAPWRLEQARSVIAHSGQAFEAEREMVRSLQTLSGRHATEVAVDGAGMD